MPIKSTPAQPDRYADGYIHPMEAEAGCPAVMSTGVALAGACAVPPSCLVPRSLLLAGPPHRLSRQFFESPTSFFLDITDHLVTTQLLLAWLSWQSKQPFINSLAPWPNFIKHHALPTVMAVAVTIMVALVATLAFESTPHFTDKELHGAKMVSLRPGSANHHVPPRTNSSR